MEISDIISIGSLIIVAIEGVVALCQWKKNLLFTRAKYINELTEKIRTDDAIKNTIYLFDYDDDWYTGDFHEGKHELEIDKTLSVLSYICYLYDCKAITSKEFKFFQYEVERTLANTGVKDYLYNLYHFSHENNTSTTFYYLVHYGEKHGLLDKVFFDKEAWMKNTGYHRYLNF